MNLNITVHLKMRNHECLHCGQAFAQAYNLKNHVKSIHLKIKDEVCTLCKKLFSNKHKLSDHIRRVHLKEKNYNCLQCDYQSFDSSGLKRHTIKHNKH